ncbi:MAG: polysaccharide biosynthesis protein [Phycisphaeraceae bacterium]|nr:MAG: polysaccharide biosynthesis protein [Phycisphaeraceae bacterium]
MAQPRRQRGRPTAMHRPHTIPDESQPSIVLIGTPETLRAASGALGALTPPPEALGLVLLQPQDPDEPAISDLPILGVVDDLPRLHTRFGFEAALVSLPAAMPEAIARVRTALLALGVAERFMAPVTDVLAGIAPSPAAGAASALDMPALIGRSPQPIDEAVVRDAVQGRRVLITGAGGSIGAELARRVASFDPAALFLMDRSDNALFEIDRQIGARHPGLERRAILHDVVDADPTLRRFVAIRPHMVIHAAAHKHVPMMEDHPAHAVNNNLFGTKSVADASVAVGVERFVMVSTDKAVNPTSVMGATKALAEQYVRALNGRSATRLCLVRFGNVLASACSVIPIWERQIGEGGPVTVTDPRMTRYFMTIPEAASLVIQAASLDPERIRGADVFVLDMGEPVNILDLARRFIRAHGFDPRIQDPRHLAPGEEDAVVRTQNSDHGTPFDIVFTGARPGEKLHEELAHQADELRPTPAPGIMAWRGPEPEPGALTEMIADLSAVRATSDDRAVIDAIGRWVPGFSGRPARKTTTPAFTGAA